VWAWGSYSRERQIGLAMAAFWPMVEMQFAEIVTVAYDQIATVAAKKFFLAEGPTPVPMVVRMPYGSSLCDDSYMSAAAPPHSQCSDAWFCHLGGAKFVMRSSSGIERVRGRGMPVPPAMRAKAMPPSRAQLERTIRSFQLE